MSPTVELDDEVFNALQRLAEPLVDDVNSVLRRLLSIEPDGDTTLTSGGSRSLGGRQRVARGTIVPEADYEIPLLEALVEMGGRAATSEVVDRVGEKLGDRLGPLDRQPLAGGDIRWRNRAQFVRLKLVRSGEMRDDSPRGIWEITDAGRARIGRG